MSAVSTWRKSVHLFTILAVLMSFSCGQVVYAAPPEDHGAPVDVDRGHADEHRPTDPGPSEEPPTPAETPASPDTAPKIPASPETPVSPEAPAVTTEAPAAPGGGGPSGGHDVRLAISHFGIRETGVYSEPDNQPTGIGRFTDGAIGPFVEGACIPAIIEVQNSGREASDINLSLLFDYKKPAGSGTEISVASLEGLTSRVSGDLLHDVDNLNDFAYPRTDLSSTTSFSTDSDTSPSVSASIRGPFTSGLGSGSPGRDDEQRHYDVTLLSVPPSVTVHLLFCARLGEHASLVPESHVDVQSDDAEAGVILINGNQLVTNEVAGLTLQKIVSGGTSTPDQWSFDVSPAIGGVTHFLIPSSTDRVVIPDAVPGTSYTIHEVGPSGYVFGFGAGEACTFSEGVATALLPATHGRRDTSSARCTFTNKVVLPQLTVLKQVVNDNGGTLTASSVVLLVDEQPVTYGVATTVDIGAHVVSEIQHDGYSSSFSRDCDEHGRVTLAAGERKVCLITNNDIDTSSTSTPPTPTSTSSTVTTGTIQVVTTIINDNGGTGTASDFSVTVSSTGATPSTFAGSTSGVVVTVATGTYSVIQTTTSSTYATTYSAGCNGILSAGTSIVCTITNNDISSTSTTTTTETGGGSGSGSGSGGSTGGSSTDTGSGGGSSGSGGNGGSSGTAGASTSAGTTNGGGGATSFLPSSPGPAGSLPAPTPRVLGDTEINFEGGACVLVEQEAQSITTRVEDITNRFGIARQGILESFY